MNGEAHAVRNVFSDDVTSLFFIIQTHPLDFIGLLIAPATILFLLFYMTLWFIYIAGDSRVQTRIRMPNPMAAVHCTETIPIAQTRTRIPIQIQIPNRYCNHIWDGYPYPDWYPRPSPAMQISNHVDIQC